MCRIGILDHLGMSTMLVPPERGLDASLVRSKPLLWHISDILKTLEKAGKIDTELYEQLRPTGSQPARLYGLAKVHKSDMPVRPVLSMPGSVYYNVAKQVAKWLSVIPECQINCSTKSICDSLGNVKLEENEELVSFDVVSLYTNVPVMEAIHVCADLLFKKCSLPVVNRHL